MSRMSKAAAFVFAIALSAAAGMPARAGSAQTATTAAAGAGNLQSPSTAGKDIPCTCRYNGQLFDQGQQVCIRGEMAVCGMYLNNTSWKFTKAPCPLAAIAPANPLR